MYTIFDEPVDLHDLLSHARVAAASCEDGRPTHSPERMAGMALELARLHDQILDALEPLKEALRAVAREDLDGDPEGIIEMEGDSAEGDCIGFVTVTFPEVGVKLSKNADIKRLRRSLGSRFNDYFDSSVTYTPRKDFKGRVEAALRTTGSEESPRQAEARLVLAAVETLDPTPRVGFKPALARKAS